MRLLYLFGLLNYSGYLIINLSDSCLMYFRNILLLMIPFHYTQIFLRYSHESIWNDLLNHISVHISTSVFYMLRIALCHVCFFIQLHSCE